jgi:hypothetical protein
MNMSNAMEPAFPHFDTGETGTRTGLTKLEYFAGLAMQGLLANPSASYSFHGAATDAALFAQALITELERTTP